MMKSLVALCLFIFMTGAAIAQTNKGIETCDGQGSLIRKEVKTVDPQTGRIVWSTYGPNGSKAEDRSFTVNDQSPKRSEVTQYNANGTTTNRTISTGDAGARRIVRYDYNREGALQRKTSETRELDAYGNQSRITTSRWDADAGRYEPIAISYYTITYY